MQVVTAAVFYASEMYNVCITQKQSLMVTQVVTSFNIKHTEKLMQHSTQYTLT